MLRVVMIVKVIVQFDVAHDCVLYFGRAVQDTLSRRKVSF